MPAITLKFLKTLFAHALLAGLLLVGCHGYAQNPSQIDVLTTDQGLLFRDITSITQDANQAMWFGTDLGLVRYDGYNFKVYNSDKSNPFYMEEELLNGELVFDKNPDELWYMANEKLFKLQLSTDNVMPFNSSHNIKGQVFRLLKNHDGSIWIVTDDSLTAETGKAKQYLQKLENGKFKVIHSISTDINRATGLIKSKEGHILWSSPEGSVKFDAQGNVLSILHFSKFNWNGVQTQFTVSFYASDSSHYFFPQKERGIFTFNEIDLTSKRIFDNENQFYYAVEDHQKQIWFAGEKELYRMNVDGEFTNYTEQLKSIFEYSKINAVFIDSNKLLWIATDNGLFKIRIGEDLFKPLFKSVNVGWGNAMRGIFEDANGTIFAKCENQNKLFYKTISGKVDTLHIKLNKQALESSQYTSNFYVLDSKKEHVFTLGETLLKINLKNGKTKSYDLFKHFITFKGQNPLIKLKDGRLLFGQSLKRLVLFDPITETSELVFNNHKLKTDIADFRYFKESIKDRIVWIGTQKNGLLNHHEKGRHPIFLPFMTIPYCILWHMLYTEVLFY
jgi:ligand-binding sensor domain-containing protein